MHEAVKTYMAGLDKQLDVTPFGVPTSLGTWGGSGAVVDMAMGMYFLHKASPDLVGPEYTLYAVNYILGTHRFPALRMKRGWYGREDHDLPAAGSECARSVFAGQC